MTTGDKARSFTLKYQQGKFKPGTAKTFEQPELSTEAAQFPPLGFFREKFRQYISKLLE